MSREVVLVRTGTANLASVTAALQRAGATVRVADDAAPVRDADRVVLPGVGAFGAAATRLTATPVAAALVERIESGRPLLAICLGLQLLARSSEETPGVRGLGLFDVPVRRLPDGVRVPQLGWNEVVPEAGCRVVESGYAYFANSYALRQVPEGWCGAMAEHGVPFVAALERGSIVACQFHPELSGAWGAALLGRWLEAAC